MTLVLFVAGGRDKTGYHSGLPTARQVRARGRPAPGTVEKTQLGRLD
jgi:hypothetical protein